MIWVCVTLDSQGDRGFQWHDATTGIVPPRPSQPTKSEAEVMKEISKSLSGQRFRISPTFSGNPSKIALPLNSDEVKNLKLAGPIFDQDEWERLGLIPFVPTPIGGHVLLKFAN